MFSRRPSLVAATTTSNTFELITQHLEDLPNNSNYFTADQISAITEHIIVLSKEEDLMSLAKNASKNLYPNLKGAERVEKINILVMRNTRNILNIFVLDYFFFIFVC